MKEILNLLFEHKKLSKEQAKEILINITEGIYKESQIAAFITVYLMRNISPEELEGFREALLEMCVDVKLDCEKFIDMCGTGGDGKNTFNISTSAAFVVAGAGYKVGKHGNYGVSSTSGSSNLLESLGYKFTNDVSRLNQQLDKSNICFMHAPMFHPALKSVGYIRRDLGVKTFFNMLGPLVNPARPKYQIAGVFNLQLLRLYQNILTKTHDNYFVLHTIDGFDEVSLTADVKLASKYGESLINHEDFKFQKLQPIDLFGGNTKEEAVNIFIRIINNEANEAQRNVIIANAALAIKCLENEKPLEECIAIANESLQSGKAKEALTKLLELN